VIALLITEKEKRELIYLMERELDELLFEIQDRRMEGEIKEIIDDRYRIVFSLFKRIASHDACMKYIPMRTRRPRTRL
jgi:hypothetical protein